MHLRKNHVRMAVFALTGVIALTTVFVLNQQQQEESNAISGSWKNNVSTSWYNASDARYASYETAPGTSKDAPFLIMNAEEFSGIRNFEGDDELAGKYLKLANDIDLSAHYWDPIELYGSGDPWDDMYDIDYSEGYWVADDSEVVHFDGGDASIKGLTILNTYDQVPVYAEDWGDAWVVEAGATGLFSFAYKARIANVNLVSPSITLTETSGVDALNWDGTEIDVVDVAGSVVGAAFNSRIIDVRVRSPKIDYTALFGENISDNEYPQYYAPQQILIGGAVGYSFGQTTVGTTAVIGGSINVKPIVNETLFEFTEEYNGDTYTYYPYMDALYDGGVKIGGIVGFNFQSVILSTCNSSDIDYSDANYTLNPDRDPSRPNDDGNEGVVDSVEETYYWLPNYLVSVGGITGTSSSEYSFQACVYNSCAHSDISVITSKIQHVATGGIVGLLHNDTLINSFFDGEIAASQSDFLGEIVGVVDNSSSGFTVASNYYLARGSSPYGEWYDGDIRSDSFAPIISAEQLAVDLNRGRALVIADAYAHTGGVLSIEFLNDVVTDWAIGTSGTSVLDCVGTLGVGLNLTSGLGAPNTGKL